VLGTRLYPQRWRLIGQYGSVWRDALALLGNNDRKDRDPRELDRAPVVCGRGSVKVDCVILSCPGESITWHEYVAWCCLDADLQGSGMSLANSVSSAVHRRMGSAKNPKSEIDSG